jgi:hypothetical protein
MNEKEQKSLLAGALASDPVDIDAKILTLICECNHVEISKDIATNATSNPAPMPNAN